MNLTMTPEETKTAPRGPAENPGNSAPRPPTKPTAAPASAQAVPALAVKNLSVFFGKHQVLKSVSLNVEARAVTAIIGPSGCGKFPGGSGYFGEEPLGIFRQKPGSQKRFAQY